MTLSKFVEYIKQAWANRPSATTPISAERLLHMESGIKANNESIQELAAAVVSAIVNDSNKIASMAALYAVNQAVTELNSKLSGCSGYKVRRHLVPLTFVEKTFNGKTYGEAEYAHYWGYIGPTTYSVMAMQSTEEGAEGIVNPACDVISTYNTDGNKTKIIALNPDGSAYTGAVWITILAIGN